MQVLLDKFNKIVEDTLGRDFIFFLNVVPSIYDELAAYSLESYMNNREVIQDTISIMSKNERMFITWQYVVIMKNFEAIYSNISKEESIDKIWQEYIKNDFNEESIIPILENVCNASKVNNLSLLSNNMEIANKLTLSERKLLSSFIISSVQRYGEQMKWDKNTIENHLFYLVFLRSIALKDNILTAYYLTANNIIDRLNTSGYHQKARDLAESILVNAYDDKQLTLGFLCISRAYLGCHNLVASLLFYNLMLICLNKEGKCTPFVAYEIIWLLLKICREFKSSKEEQLDMLCFHFDKLKTDEYKCLSFYHTYFSTKLILTPTSQKLQQQIVDFLNKNRERILFNGGHSALPWYSLIISMKNYQQLNNEMLLYEIVFRRMLDVNGNDLIKDIGSHQNLAYHLKELLYKLEDTRNVDDYSKDTQLLLVISKKLIEEATSTESVENFVLAMRPKTDCAFFKKNIPATNIKSRINIEDVNGQEIKIPYIQIDTLNDLTQTYPNDAIIWVGKGDKSTCFLTKIRNMYRFLSNNTWNGMYTQGISNELVQFVNSERLKDGSLYYKGEADYEEETKNLKNELQEYCTELPNIADRYLFIMDIEYCGYPCNLILDSRTNKFVGEIGPTANLVSTELYIITNFNENPTSKYTKAFWMPKDTGDFTFQNIYSHIEECLNTYNFHTNLELNPSKPISADLNIICAHGGSNIGTDGVLYTDCERITDITKIIGGGKILIAFVCYSGTIKRESYDNAMHTFIKRFLRNGYDAVIAPMWTLATDLIPIWLPTFLKSFESGFSIIDSLFKANMAIKEKYPTPKAWACMHLFGNPYVKITNKENQ